MKRHFDSVTDDNCDHSLKRGTLSGAHPSSTSASDHNIPFNRPLTDAELAELLDAAPALPPVTPTAIRRLILDMESAITENMEMRLRHPNEPEKFMDSEVKLDECLKNLSVITTTPSHIALLVKHAAIPSLLSLITHQNNDIVGEVLSLLEELTDADVLLADECDSDTCDLFLKSLIDCSIFNLLCAHLSKLSYKNDEDTPIITHIFNILENLINIKSSLSSDLIQSTSVVTLLIEWLWQTRSVGNNKHSKRKTVENQETLLQASEILSILLQSSSSLLSPSTTTFSPSSFDRLLVILSSYRTRPPLALIDEEICANVFSVLCSALLLPENQSLFVKHEGIQLLLLFLRISSSSALGKDGSKEKDDGEWLCRCYALRLLDFALQRHPLACDTLIQQQGLKLIFPIFMHPGHEMNEENKNAKSKRNKNKRNVTEVTSGLTVEEEERHSISVVLSLLRYSTGQTHQRVLYKFLEIEYVKLDRLCELLEKYEESVSLAMSNFTMTSSNDRDIDEDDIDLRMYMTRMDAGLFTLQQLSLCIALLINEDDLYSSHGRDGANEIRKRVSTHLHQRGGNLEDNILRYLLEMADEAADNDDDDNEDGEDGGVDGGDDMKNVYVNITSKKILENINRNNGVEEAAYVLGVAKALLQPLRNETTD